jgi:hypothetical protein
MQVGIFAAVDSEFLHPARLGKMLRFFVTNPVNAGISPRILKRRTGARAAV